MAVSSSIRFKDVAVRALGLASVLLPEWLPGSRRGTEWVGMRRANGGLGDSWSVNVNTGKWAHFGGDEVGGDLVSLYAALHDVEPLAALERVAVLVGINGSGVPLLPVSAAEMKAPAKEPALELIPANAPAIPPHDKDGMPCVIYPYGNEFIVGRYESADGKAFHPFRWRRGKWWCKAAPVPRRIYNLEDLEAKPFADVLIVEGEKCVEALRDILTSHVVVTWSNGSNSVGNNRWDVLQGRNVVIWPDADEAGHKATMILVKKLTPLAKNVRVIPLPDDVREGWDLADAVAEGWDEERIVAWMNEPTRKPTEPSPDDAPKRTVVTGDTDSAFVSWQSLGLQTNEGGLPYPTLANASLILSGHPRSRGRLWFDTFTGKTMHTFYGAEQEWNDDDDVDLTAWIQQTMRLHKFTVSTVRDAVGHAARRHRRNSLTDWLDSLEWDGEERLNDWVIDYLGVERTEYTMALSRNWPISMVARAYVPGCQVDTMPVLEGKQGRGKSSFLKALGDPWYKALPQQFGEKDFLQAIQGAWLVEIPDMTGFSRREHGAILATIAIRTDVYRPTYGHRVLSHPRVTVFAATSETDDYLKETRGIRRYWPVRCEDIHIEALQSVRDRIFAEAVVKYRTGASWWEMPEEETEQEQLARSNEDVWGEAILDSAETLWGAKIRITSSRLLTEIKVPIERQDDGTKGRVARILRANGWAQGRAKDRSWKKIVRAPGAYKKELP
jgi:putative DNA primase/helicase